MCENMVHIQSARAEIRRWKKRRNKEEERRNHGKNIMPASICYAVRPWTVRWQSFYMFHKPRVAYYFTSDIRCSSTGYTPEFALILSGELTLLTCCQHVVYDLEIADGSDVGMTACYRHDIFVKMMLTVKSGFYRTSAKHSCEEHGPLI